MIEVVGSPQRIEQCKNLLRDRLRRQMVHLEEPQRLGWKGGGTESRVWYHPDSELWEVFESRLQRKAWIAGWLGRSA